MWPIRVSARFYATRREAAENGPNVVWPSGRDCKLLAREATSAVEWTFTVESVRNNLRAPTSPTEVPDLPFVYLHGGTIFEVKWRVWDGNTNRLTLSGEVVGLAE